MRFGIDDRQRNRADLQEIGGDGRPQLTLADELRRNRASTEVEHGLGEKILSRNRQVDVSLAFDGELA